MRLMVTGGSGFIGSALIRQILTETDAHVINIDCLTYAASRWLPDSDGANSRYRFEHIDITERSKLDEVFSRFQPNGVIHLAAESHVDRSIDSADAFLNTNVVGTFHLLEAALKYYRTLDDQLQKQFRFHHVSTDEVYGSLGDCGKFNETTAYAPNSPYAASKAASDHFVRAWYRTYGLPVVSTNCSNNYGPYQHPEKLIPLMIVKALDHQPLPIYGDGQNIRDWLYVDDHARAIRAVYDRATTGAHYNVGGASESTNLTLVRRICDLLDEVCPNSAKPPRRDSIEFVNDRLGHDRRYAIDASKIRRDLGWFPQQDFDSGLRKTIMWYLENSEWLESTRSTHDVGARLGLANQGTP